MKRTYSTIRTSASIVIALCLFACTSHKENHILVIGDSHGAIEKGWVDQLKQLQPNDSIINYCISGNTIGFDNLGRDTLNTLKNINAYLSNAVDSVGDIDRILILLGTNDCKAVFDSLQYEVPVNMNKLITTIYNFRFPNNKTPDITIISPPPTAHDSLLLPKYYGITERVDELVNELYNVAIQQNCQFIISFPLSYQALTKLPWLPDTMLCSSSRTKAMNVRS